MNDLLVSALHGTAAYPIAQAQVLVVAHARRVIGVVADERLQIFPQLRRRRAQGLESGDDWLHVTGAEVVGKAVHPTVGPLGSFTVAEAGKSPGMLDGMPEVEDFAAAFKQGGAFPDPLRAIAHDHHHGVSSQPAPFPESCPEVAAGSWRCVYSY